MHFQNLGLRFSLLFKVYLLLLLFIEICYGSALLEELVPLPAPISQGPPLFYTPPKAFDRPPLLPPIYDGLGQFMDNSTENFWNPAQFTVQLRATDGEVDPIDCKAGHFMFPFRGPVDFEANSSVGARHDHTCIWEFYGTEPCIPRLTCDFFDLSDNCNEEYVEVIDGYGGQVRYCGSVGPANISASGDLRDLYVKFVSRSQPTGSEEGEKLSCTVSCSVRRAGTKTQLLQQFQPKINPRCYCGGKPNDNRIVGGVAVERNEFPWLVSIVMSNTRQPFCGGSIVNDRIILTAAHCFKVFTLNIQNIEVLVNAHTLDSTPNFILSKNRGKNPPQPLKYDRQTLTSLDARNGSIRHQVQEIFVHPLYLTETNDFDVAVLLLSKPIDFGRRALPICLPEPGSYLRTFLGEKSTVAGWGLTGLTAEGTPTNLLKLENLTVFSRNECRRFYQRKVSRRMLCSGFKEGVRDSCSGDSGGPLIVEDMKAVWYQIGVVSWGDGCAQKNSPGVYYRTTEAAQWIHYHSNTNEAVWCDTDY